MPMVENKYYNLYYNEKGELHRLDGPALEWANGEKNWFQNGKRHRLDGPAIEYANGEKYWYQNGIRHRIDGPACEYASGYKQWYYQGEFINCSSQEKFERIIRLKCLW